MRLWQRTLYLCSGRASAILRSRLLHLINNQATVAVLTNRLRSQRLVKIVRKSSAPLLATGVRRTLGYTETDREPAEKATRGKANFILI